MTAVVVSDTTESANGSLDKPSVLRLLSGSSARSGILALVDQFFFSLTTFVMSVVVGRSCTESQLGLFTLGVSIVVLATAVQASLITTPFTVLINGLPSEERPAYAGAIFARNGVLAALLMILMGVGALLGPYFSELSGASPVMWAVTATLPCVMLREFARRTAFADLRMWQALAIDAAVLLVQIGLLIATLRFATLTPGTAHLIVGGACGLIGVAWLSLSIRDGEFDFGNALHSKFDLTQHWSFAKWVFGADFAAVFALRSLPWTITMILGNAATGAYAACLNVVLLTNPFMFGVANVMSPKTAMAHAEGGEDKVRQIVSRATLLLAVVMFCFLTVVFFAGDWFVQILFGSQYGGQSHLIRVLALGVFSRALGIPVKNGLRAINRPICVAWANGFGLLLTVAVSVAAMLLFRDLKGAGYGLFIGYASADIVAAYCFYCGRVPTPKSDGSLS